jgi:hypothetical protein
MYCEFGVMLVSVVPPIEYPKDTMSYRYAPPKKGPVPDCQVKTRTLLPSNIGLGSGLTVRFVPYVYVSGGLNEYAVTGNDRLVNP